MEYMLVSTEKYNFFQSRNPGIWALRIPGFGIPGLQSLVVYFSSPQQQQQHHTHGCQISTLQAQVPIK